MISPFIIVSLFIMFIYKHYVCDFLLQKPYQYLNKGKYGHPGGIIHAGIHAIGTFFVLLIGSIIGYVPFWGMITLPFVDGIIHYHIDWAKVYICSKKDWTCNNSSEYWIMFGFDQCLHYMTYALIVLLLV